MRTKINKIENRKTIKNINENKSWLLEKSNEMDKPGSRRGKGEKVQITNVIKKLGHHY